jgi:sugar phosphate isomerase/epimerase
MEERLGIEFISVFGLPPVELVKLTAELGGRYIGTSLAPMDYNPHQYPKFSLRDDPALRRELIAAMRDTGVSISLGEGLVVWPQADVADLAADLDAMLELGVRRLNTVSFDPDLSRSFDQFAKLVEMAEQAGVETTIECVPGLTVADLPTALAAIRHVGRPSFRLLIDTMHVLRSGSTLADLAALDPTIFGYIQLSDVPLVPTVPDYMEEAMYDRKIPGEGELPLRDLLALLPRDLVIGLEIPRRALAEQEIGPRERMAPAFAAARSLLASLPPVSGQD